MDYCIYIHVYLKKKPCSAQNCDINLSILIKRLEETIATY